MYMLRRALLNTARASRPLSMPAVASPALRVSRPVAVSTFRAYSAAAGLSKEDITERILSTLKSFEKVPQDKLTATSSFSSDLGLDSLDAVEVVMAVEEEFGIEIPDEEADAIQTVQQAIEYIAKTPEAR